MMKRSAQTLSLMTLSSVALASSIPDGLPYIRMKDLPGVANPEAAQWTSVDKDMEFLPVDNVRLPPGSLRFRNLEEEEEEGDSEQASDASAYRVQPFVEGIGEYDEYQQAWRMLGFMIDCNSVDYQNGNDNGHHSNDQEMTEDGCSRYILWAAYVDLEYEGSGIAEYQYWNSTTSSWDKSACNYAENGNSRCAKMDCHLEDTHFSLLGFFKHRNYDDWMEQLFKHEGMCVWTEEEYAFMKKARKSWPRGCTYSGSQTSDGAPLYFDIKPMSKGRIAVGLYTDTKCTADYSSDTDLVEDLIGNFFVENGGGSGDQNYDFSGDTLEESQARWDAAFSVWSYCHPCVAYDITNTDGTKYLYNDDDGNRRELGGEHDAEGELFECYDDAGYTNVNQCMKFSAKTVMQTATFRDMSLSRVQGSLVDAPLAGYLNSGGEYVHDMMGAFFTYLLFAATLVCCCYNTYSYYVVKRATKYNFQGDMDDIMQQSGYDKRQGLVSDSRRTHEFA